MNLIKCKEIFKLGVVLILLIFVCVSFKGCQSERQVEEWIITQHGWWDGTQLMFYTITNEDGNLIVIDGGLRDNADEFRGIIAEKGNHIDIWILTHPHFDHVGAFIEVWPDLRDITVGRVITAEMPTLEHALASYSYDDGTFEEFYALDLSEVELVETGDVFTFLNLNFHIISVWGEHVEEVGINFLNNGSMMFMMSGSEDRMLFCADVEYPMSEWLIRTYGEGLNANFIQLGHHGNGSTTLPKEFLDLVAPEIAFFDAPWWLFEDPHGLFKMDWIIGYMYDNDVSYYNFKTAPNSITFR